MQQTIQRIDVVVGEANDGHAELLEASLREIGIVNNLYRGADGAETLAFIHGTAKGCQDEQCRPSLVFLDCGLPRVGGVDVLRALKSDRRHSWIPVIMLTCTRDPRRIELFRHLGCAAYVTKWSVFLGLRGFAMKVRRLAYRSLGTASRRRAFPGVYGSTVGAIDARSMLDTVRIREHRRINDGEEVRDGASTR